MVLASVAIAVKIKTPPEEGPRVLGDRITVSHILNPAYRPRHFNGSWISGKTSKYFLNFCMIELLYPPHELKDLQYYSLFKLQIMNSSFLTQKEDCQFSRLIL